MGHEKDDGITEGVISSDESPRDNWLGIGVAVVPGMGGGKGPGEAINNSFVSMVRCWTGAICWGPSTCCRFASGLSSQSSSEKKSSSFLKADASPQLTKKS